MDKHKAEIDSHAGAHDDQSTAFEDERSGGFEDRVSTVALQLIFLIHGGIIGGGLDNVVLGLFIGIVASALLDLCMGTQSLVLSFTRYVANKLCSAVTSLAHAFAARSNREDVSVPSRLADMRCRFSQ